jgi:hypothetical protein
MMMGARRGHCEPGSDAPTLHVTLPRLLRKHLAELILDSLHDPRARDGLHAVARLAADPKVPARFVDLPPRALRDSFEERAGSLQVKDGWKEHAEDLGERARRAARAIDRRPLDPPDAPLRVAMDAAATLFDAGLYYEVHEWLEPYWLRAEGGDRPALQGLIQVAVGFEHLTSGNVIGARALLANGCAKLEGRQIEGIDLDGFERAVHACLAWIDARNEAAREFDPAVVPRFPTRTSVESPLTRRAERAG